MIKPNTERLVLLYSEYQTDRRPIGPLRLQGYV